MQTTAVKQTNKLQTGIVTLESEISRMKRVLPFVKDFRAKRDIGGAIRARQSEIRQIKKQIFEINF